MTYSEDAYNEQGYPEKVIHVSEQDWFLLKPILAEALATYKTAYTEVLTNKLNEYNQCPDRKKEREISILNIQSLRISELNKIFR